MALLVDGSSPANHTTEAPSFRDLSPSSDSRFWSTLRGRVDTLLENRSCENNLGGSDRRKRLKEDSLLLLRGFDSVADTLSQLHHNLDNALQGARDLAQPPTLNELFHHKLEKKREADREDKSDEGHIPETEKEEEEGGIKELKRKFEGIHESSDDQGDHKSVRNDGKLENTKKLAVSMATKANSLARELKSIKSDLWFTQDRCALLEEENRRLRNGLAKGIQPEEDDLVRLQLEALLAEKARLANENANLARENACLNQLVEYHQITSRELLSPASYEQAVRSLDFSSPLPHIEEEEGCHGSAPVTPRTDIVGVSTATPDEKVEGCNDKAPVTPRNDDVVLLSTTPLEEWHSAEQQL